MTTMKRYEAIKEIMKEVDDDTIVVVSNGMPSRDLYTCADRSLNLYLTGGMGSSLAVGMGMALNTNRNVIVISGDGAAAMGWGTTLVNQPDNLEFYILLNGVHATTGGQPCVQAGEVGFEIDKDKGDSPRVGISLKENIRRFMDAVKQ